MIELYSGTPGSGKSFHACQKIYNRLKYTDSGVVANFPIKLPKKFKSKGYFNYVSNDDMTIDYLLWYSQEFNRKGREHEALIVIDEAGIKFNSRQWNSPDRFQWLNFFSQHRKLGYDIILISQSDNMIDKQIRSFIEVQDLHRKVTSGGIATTIAFIGMGQFINIRTYYGNKYRIGVEHIRYSKKIADIYDSFALFNDFTEDEECQKKQQIKQQN
jgi:zona occludens toxin (predicted ATPase)